jgi:hypothetical protein
MRLSFDLCLNGTVCYASICDISNACRMLQLLRHLSDTCSLITLLPANSKYVPYAAGTALRHRSISDADSYVIIRKSLLYVSTRCTHAALEFTRACRGLPCIGLSKIRTVPVTGRGGQ